MSKLFSGKEAYNLIGQGVEVQAHVEYEKGLLEWQDAKELPACDILNGHFDFRLKPRTITINGVEVPAPFEPKDGDVVFVLDNANPNGFSSFIFDSDFFIVNFGAWRTESEIKQVVSALRSVFKPQ